MPSADNAIPRGFSPIFSVANTNGEDQISFQVPWETDTGSGAAFIQIFDYGTVVGTARVDSFIEDPGIFAYQRDGAQQAVAVHGSDDARGAGKNDPDALDQ